MYEYDSMLVFIDLKDAQVLFKMDNNVIDGYLIALKELEEKKIPFIIRRPIPNGGSEYWKLSELENII